MSGRTAFGVEAWVKSLKEFGFHADAQFPYIRVKIAKRASMFREAHRLLRVLGEPWKVEATYDPSNGECLLVASDFGFAPDSMHREGLDA